MSTRSLICRKNEKGEYACVYCHWDGYPEHNGRILLECYADPEDVKNLISMGDISSLGEKILPDFHKEHSLRNPQNNVCVFYHRDRNEWWKDTAPKAFISDLELIIASKYLSYIYVFQDGNWYYSANGAKSFRLLTKAVCGMDE